MLFGNIQYFLSGNVQNPVYLINQKLFISPKASAYDFLRLMRK